MSIPDYRIFFRRCAAFFLAGVLAAGSASAQQEAPPAAAPEQAEEAKAEQPQEQPDQSEMDTVIMARFHILCGKSFADGDEADGTRRTSGAEFRCAYAGENMFQILLDAHDGWFSSGMAVRTRGS